MGSVGQIAASIPSILANGALTAGMGALACAAGAALGSTALPSIAGGAIAIGSQTIIGRTVSVILHETDCGKQIPLGIRAITGLAMFPISIFAGAAIATAAGIPVTFSAAVYTLFASAGLGIAIVLPIAAVTGGIFFVYVAKNGVPAFLNEAIQERIRNTPHAGQRELLRQALDRLHNLHRPARMV